MSYKTIVRGLIAVAVTHLSFSATHGQTLKYESRAEVYGAAMTSPSIGKVVIERLFTHCASYGDEVKEKQDYAMRNWLEIHQPLIDENLRLREDFRRNASNETVEEFKKFLAETASVREVVVSGLDWPTPYWPELAVKWLEDGAPMDDEIAKSLLRISNTKKFPGGSGIEVRRW